MNMKSKFKNRCSKQKGNLMLGLFLTMIPILAAAEEIDNSALIKALNDELNRSMTELVIANQAKPYYLGYRVKDNEYVQIKAELGGLIRSETSRSRELYVDLRLGGYNFDNSNFICQMDGSGYIDSDVTNLPLDNDYDAIRHAIWMVTDGTYKKSLEELSRKKAVVQNQPQKDSLADFSRPAPCLVVQPVDRMSLDVGRWEKDIVRISSLFKKFPKIQESSVTLRGVKTDQYFLDSEGNKNLSTRQSTAIEVLARTQSITGEPMEDFISFCYPAPTDFPKLENILAAVEAMAETLSLAAGLKCEEEYSGPVLLVGQAAAEFFFQVFGKGVADPRASLFENEMLGKRTKNEMGFLCGRIGRKIMPEFLSAYDEPGLETWQGTALVGRFLVDEQGVLAQHVDLVQRGKLTGVYMSRAPVKKVFESNGHGFYHNETFGYRYVGLPGILRIEADSSNSDEELKRKLIEMCRDYGTSYGIVISRLAMTRPQSPTERLMRYYAGGEKADQPLLSTPAVIYRLDVETGRLDLIRGLDFSSLTTRVLRDIVSAGNMQYVHNFLYRDDQGNTYPMSVIAPSILIEEADMVANDLKASNRPLLKNPLFIAPE